MSIPKGFKPMLAPNKSVTDFSALRFPLYASPKLDGIRCTIFGGVAYSRKLEVLPNKRLQAFARAMPDGFDGELISGEPVGDDVWNRAQSCVMEADSRDPLTFYVFDWINPAFPEQIFAVRFDNLRQWMLGNGMGCLKYVQQRLVRSERQLDLTAKEFIAQGYEGAMLRSQCGGYKYGRATEKQATLLKVKAWVDYEVRVIGYKEAMHNGNEAKKGKLGQTKRSTHKANKTGKGTLGALVCEFYRSRDGNAVSHKKSKAYPDRMRCSVSGFKKDLAQKLWDIRDTLPGKLAKMKSQGFTPDGAPRFPGFLGLRDERDV